MLAVSVILGIFTISEGKLEAFKLEVFNRAGFFNTFHHTVLPLDLQQKTRKDSSIVAKSFPI